MIDGASGTTSVTGLSTSTSYTVAASYCLEISDGSVIWGDETNASYTTKTYYSVTVPAKATGINRLVYRYITSDGATNAVEADASSKTIAVCEDQYVTVDSSSVTDSVNYKI